MAVTTTIINRGHEGNLRKVLVGVQFDSSYPTGGEPWDAAADIGLGTIFGVSPLAITVNGAFSTERAIFDTVSKKLMLHTAAGVEVANATDRSTTVARLEVIGR